MAYTDLAMIAQDVILEKYGDTTSFSTAILHGDSHLISDWVSGDVQLSGKQLQEIRKLFTDYEWMLCQKAIFQAQTIPELDNKAAYIYNQAKKHVAQHWVKADNCKSAFKDELVLKRPVIHLRLTLNYDLWGFNDVLDFIVPARIQRAIETQELDLLTWADNLQVSDRTVG
ncbi:MAG: hypothetical protein LKF36_10690 [Lactobacillus sp.]|jgi:hypothetical protein|nr:hypothetical protein [Lactobacillus sp.]